MHNFWEVFDAAASRFPGNVAVEVQRAAGLEQVTYKGLQGMAESIAGWLTVHGIAAGDRCAILADNDARWCGVYLAMLRIGAVAVPLDTNYSAAQVTTVLAASGARLLVAGTRLLPVAEQALSGTALPLVRDVRGAAATRATRSTRCCARPPSRCPPVRPAGTMRP